MRCFIFEVLSDHSRGVWRVSVSVAQGVRTELACLLEGLLAPEMMIFRSYFRKLEIVVLFAFRDVVSLWVGAVIFN